MPSPLSGLRVVEMQGIGPAPLAEDHDLFVMTRLADGSHADLPPEACFFNIVAQAGTGEDA